MGIQFWKDENRVLLEYSSESDVRWLKKGLNEHSSFNLKKVYTVFANQIVPDPDYDESSIEDEMLFIRFAVATLEGDYFKFKKDLLSIGVDVFIHKDITITHKMFYAPRNISVFKKINAIVSEDIYISNKPDDYLKSGRLPLTEFNRLRDNFPTTYQLDKYAESLVGMILGDYFDSYSEAEEKYKKLLKKKEYRKKRTRIIPALRKHEKSKYEYILETLKEMLENKEGYNEKIWQEEILDILLLIYPKYVKVFKEVPIKTEEGKLKRLDYMLLDSRGHVDIVEIKRPSEKKFMSPARYRGNYIPSKELVGSVMQVEKYIFYLNKSGKNGENKLNTDYKNQMPTDLRINIVNPKGLIIMGQEDELLEDERKDFEIVRRKYKNIIDITTYDELIRSLEQLIFKFSSSN